MMLFHVIIGWDRVIWMQKEVGPLDEIRELLMDDGRWAEEARLFGSNIQIVVIFCNFVNRKFCVFFKKNILK
jgi:predicted nucleotidyltransferase